MEAEILDMNYTVTLYNIRMIVVVEFWRQLKQSSCDCATKRMQNIPGVTGLITMVTKKMVEKLVADKRRFAL